MTVGRLLDVTGWTKNDQEHRQEKPSITEDNPMHINQTLNIKSKNQVKEGMLEEDPWKMSNVPPHLPMKTPPNYRQTPFEIKPVGL